MKENNIITVVVPIYNVSKYLNACIDSILNQNYRNLEVILVDDGSTDESAKICDEYEKKDARIIVFHKKNGGLSSARNVGIDNATGEFITFIDSDDYVGPTFIETLYESIRNWDSQISMCDFLRVDENKELDEIVINNSPRQEDFFSPEEAIKNVYSSDYHGIDFVAWAKLYRIELFTTTGIRYPEGKLHEDTFTTYKLFYEAKKLSYVDYPLYYYRIREGSIMNAQFNLKRLDMLEATREMCDFLRRKGHKELLKLAFIEHLHNTKKIISEMLQSPNVDKTDIKSVCKDLKRDISYYKDCISLERYIYYSWIASNPGILLKFR